MIDTIITSAPLLILLAWAIEAVFGWPELLTRWIKHPVIWIGALISQLERSFNNENDPQFVRYEFGVVVSLSVIGAVIASSSLITTVLPKTPVGFVIEAAIVSSLIASRSLFTHVANVLQALKSQDLAAARKAVSQIVGRETGQMFEADIARASLESLAENASDGVIAPVFWGALFGLPGLAAYKAINTLDSMIGHRNEQYHAFGGFAARLDDLANLIPARLTGILIAAASLKGEAFITMLKEAHKHRSHNAGWPEAAMAGALGIRLSGPRDYQGSLSEDQWLNAAARDPGHADIARGLSLYVRAMLLAFVLLSGTAIWSVM